MYVVNIYEDVSFGQISSFSLKIKIGIMKVAVVGSTGLVGGEMLKVLTERNFPVTELIPVASERSAGKKITFRGSEYTIVTPQTAIEMKPDLALFSAVVLLL